MYDTIVECLINAGKGLCNQRAKQHNVRPGWNDYVSELHDEAKEAFKAWVLSGKARHGPEFDRKKQANILFKYAIRFIKRNEQAMRANSMAKKLQRHNVNEFWKDV